MNTLILKPQFIDRAGRTVYFVYEDDPDCRTLRPGHLIGEMRFDGEEVMKFERIGQGELDV